ncbi:MAG: hypothetical protein Q4D06_03835 [Coriobacteriia bacterium]|nr:hypothetical protein [Coriobacteriia bacterium]
MRNEPDSPIYLASWQAVAYWLSAKPKALDAEFEQGLKAARQRTDSPIPYLDGLLALPDQVPVPNDLETVLTAEESRMICRSIGGFPPVHTMGHPKAPKANSLQYVRLRMPTQLRGNYYVQVSDRIFVPSPEFTLLQVAPQLDQIQATVLCSLFFSVFCFGRAGETTEPRRALCSRETVQAFIKGCHGKGQAPHGSAMLLRASRLAVKKTASIAELNCALRMELPRSVDGCGLPRARHNAKVNVASSSAGKEAHRWCDWLWEKPDGRKVAAEYESNQEHSGEANRKKGLVRANELMDAGITPFTLLSTHYASAEELDKVARQIARTLGTKPLDHSPEGLARRERLRASVTSAIHRFKGLVP